MKAIRLNQRGQIEIVELPKPALAKDDDVLIRITSAGICAADLEIIEGRHPFATPGNILGHEFGGVVEAVGAAVQHVGVGDKVSVDPVCACGQCHACAIGKPNVCEHLQTMGVHRNGGFCEYVCVDADHVYRFADQSISEKLLGVVEPYSIGAQNNSRANVSSADTVLVIGAGAIGLCALQDAKRRGARVIVTDLYESRLHRAESMGADIAIASRKTDIDNILKAATDRHGPDVVIITASSSSLIEDSIRYVAAGGRIVVVGLSQQPCRVNQADLVGKEISIFGSRLSSRLFGYVVEGFDNRSYAPELLVSHFFPPDAFLEAITLIRTQPESTCRVVLTF